MDESLIANNHVPLQRAANAGRGVLFEPRRMTVQDSPNHEPRQVQSCSIWPFPVDMGEGASRPGTYTQLEIPATHPKDMETSDHQIYIAALMELLHRYKPKGAPQLVLLQTGQTPKQLEIERQPTEAEGSLSERVARSIEQAEPQTSTRPEGSGPQIAVGYRTETELQGQPECVLELKPSQQRNLEIQVDTYYLDQAWVEGFGHQLVTLYTGMKAGEDQTKCHHLSEAAERWHWEQSRGQKSKEQEQGLHHLLERAAKEYPQRPAMIYAKKETTYWELERAANTLAHSLLEDLGHELGKPVGVLLPRGDQMVIAMYAILKAGGTYVPLSPSQPWAYTETMIEDIGLNILITESQQMGLVKTYQGEVFVIDFELEELATRSQPPTLEDDQERGAYVIYTSGSTGKPKGVLVTHRGVLNTITWRNQYYGITPENVNLQLPTNTFDSSVADIFCTLAAGGCLVIPEEVQRADPRLLRALISENKATSFMATPSYYRQMLPFLGEEMATINWITIAGEEISPQLVRNHYDRYPQVKLYNEYGPTENSVCSTAALLQPNEPTVPIGRAVTNVVVILLDERGQLTPPGMPGEIYLGGQGLAQGYIGYEEDSRTFQSSPVPHLYQGRVYRTRDQAYRRNDGTYVYCGRTDHQIKLRGFRIELEHIEKELMAQQGVTQAVVIKKTDENDSDYLTAYVTLDAPQETETLREALAAAIPHCMVPNYFRALENMPYNSSGKVDRKTLAQIPDTPSQQAAEETTSKEEQVMLDIWRQVLQQPNLGPTDHFFENGGTSLKTLALVNAIRERLGQEIPILHIYRHPTVREFTAKLAENETESNRTRTEQEVV